MTILSVDGIYVNKVVRRGRRLLAELLVEALVRGIEKLRIDCLLFGSATFRRAIIVGQVDWVILPRMSTKFTLADP